MKVHVIYEAYDGSKFNNEKDCLKYEQKIWYLIKEIQRFCSFLNERRKEINFRNYSDLEKMLNEFDRIYNKCDYIVIKEDNSLYDASIFIRKYFGYILPFKKGTYKYERYDWIKLN